MRFDMLMEESFQVIDIFILLGRESVWVCILMRREFNNHLVYNMRCWNFSFVENFKTKIETPDETTSFTSQRSHTSVHKSSLPHLG